jgi:hypothetical protein
LIQQSMTMAQNHTQKRVPLGEILLPARQQLPDELADVLLVALHHERPALLKTQYWQLLHSPVKA